MKDYEEDITKYASHTDKAKVLAVYNHISAFLAKENKKYQITKIAKGARNREYIGAVDWLKQAGVINVCYCLNNVELPLKGNYAPENYKLYYHEPLGNSYARETATAYGITLEDMIASGDLLREARSYVDSHNIDSIYEGGEADGISDDH